MPAGVDVRLTAGDLGEGAAHVHGDRLPATLGAPRHRAAEGPVDLADAGPVAVPAQGPAVPARHGAAGHLEQLARRDVEHDGAGGRQLVQPLHQAAGLHPAPELGELRHQRVHDGGAPTLDHRPPEAMGQRNEEPREHARKRRRERQHGMRGRAGHERPTLLGVELPGHALGGREAAQPERRRFQRMGGHGAHGAQEGREDFVHVPDERREDARGTWLRRRPSDSATSSTLVSDADGTPAVEGMGEGEGRGEQADTMGREVDVREGRGGHQERVHRRADVVTEAGHGQLRRAAAAARHVGRLVDVDRQARRGPGSTPRRARSARRRRRRRPRASPARHSASVVPSAAPMTGTGLSAKRHTVRSTSGRCVRGDGGRARRGGRRRRWRARPRIRRRRGRRTLPPPPPPRGGGSRGSGGRRRAPARGQPRGTSPIPWGPSPSAVGQWSGM